MADAYEELKHIDYALYREAIEAVGALLCSKELHALSLNAQARIEKTFVAFALKMKMEKNNG